MYKLYYSTGACSMAIHVLLNEIGVDFSLENVTAINGQKSPKLLAVNPRGAVPVLQSDDFILREGVAIILYLTSKHKTSLLADSGLQRASSLEWLAFANSTLHPAYSRMFFMHRILGDEAPKNPLYKPAFQIIQNYWDEVEQQLTKHDFISGNQVCIADILLTIIANWSSYFHEKVNFGAKTKALFNKVIVMPAFAKALQVEKVNYKANL